MRYENDRPIYLQVIEDISRRLIQGELALGEKLPSVREMAVQYQINPNTASRVYKEMESQRWQRIVWIHFFRECRQSVSIWMR